MPSLFNDVANELFCAGIDIDTAEETIKSAAKYLYPSPELVRNFHKTNGKGQTIQEYTKAWQNSLNNSAMKEFYEFYDIDGVDRTKVPSIKKNDKTSKSDDVETKSTDALNQEDFWRSVKSVTKKRPWLFSDDEVPDVD